MAEVLGTIAAALQVAELGGRLSVKLCTFAHKYKNANKALRSLSNDVALTCSVLRQLSDSLGQDDLVSLYSPDAFATAQDVLEECRKVFKDLESEIEQQHPDPSSSKSRLEKATRKIWFLMNEPRLDAVAGNLERLKSTMLLMLNVVIYAGQLRSRREMNTAQEQRELLQVLAVEKIESEKKFQQLTTSIQFFNLNVQTHGNDSTYKAQAPPKSKDELEHYYDMVKAVLGNIDTAQHFLDENRYRRLKDGFINLHHSEATDLSQKHGIRASQLFSQLGIHPPQRQIEPPEDGFPLEALKRKRAKKAGPRAVRTDTPFAHMPASMPPGNWTEMNKYPQHSVQPDNPLSVDSAFNLDFSALDRPDLLESFYFDDFLSNDANSGFGFDPSIALEADASINTPLEEKKPEERDPSDPPPYQDTSPDNPDTWILRWTNLKRDELH